MTETWEDKLAIAEVVQNWALWRDTGDWAQLRTAFHRDGVMTATWFTGSADDFIAHCRRAWEKGSRSGHSMGGCAIRIAGRKAIAQSRLILMSRTSLAATEVDVTCHGRFFDRFLKDGGTWSILRRNVVYERDRLDPVRPGEPVELDPALLARFPEGYRHLAYVQTRAGLTVNPDLPTPRSKALERLVSEAEAWLAAA